MLKYISLPIGNDLLDRTEPWSVPVLETYYEIRAFQQPELLPSMSGSKRAQVTPTKQIRKALLRTVLRESIPM
jgi:hypothetical protein